MKIERAENWREKEGEREERETKEGKRVLLAEIAVTKSVPNTFSILKPCKREILRKVSNVYCRNAGRTSKPARVTYT